MKRYDYYCQQLHFFNNLFNSAKNSNKIIKMNNDKCFNIKACEISQSGCGACKSIYSNVIFYGNLYENGQTFDYSGKISAYHLMCKCQLTKEEWDTFDENEKYLLFDIDIERDNEYLYRIFVNSNDSFELMAK